MLTQRSSFFVVIAVILFKVCRFHNTIKGGITIFQRNCGASWGGGGEGITE